MDEYSRTIACTDFELIKDETVLALQLKAMFQTPVLDPVLSALYQIIIEECGKPLKLSQDGLLSRIQDALARVSPTIDDRHRPHINALKELLESHIATTKKVRDAYKREHPTGESMAWWPAGREGDEVRFKVTPYKNKYPIMTKQTPIGVAGNCSASDFAYWFQSEGYNFVVTERESKVFEVKEGIPFAPAYWGLMSNVAAMRQLVEVSFGKRELPRLTANISIGGKRTLLDPFRWHRAMESCEKNDEIYPAHIAACREALLRSEVFLFLPFSAQVWFLKSDCSVFGQPPLGLSHTLLDNHVMSVDEIIMDLEVMLKLWRAHNPKLKLILGIAPNPLRLSFTHETQHIFEADLHSKGLLKVAFDQFCRNNDGVYYYPCLEVVTYGTHERFGHDESHLSQESFDKCFRIFKEMFVKE